ncbi:hypothetical protein B0A48_14689 [Cryoendolithus antarcticus]|uniref:Uncharacterized protein n=1 Tax=Cryoendolithus antarcticus TaxID=1507870 RepID=A0A1V8SKI7_9PEZI|nr:hypothetical protein B0A48_14689 [Cryoendolithus antarcticus]
MANRQGGGAEGSRIPEPSRVSMPLIGRRHRRSYTISSPLGTEVNAFPSPLVNLRAQTPPIRSRTPHDKENIAPDSPLLPDLPTTVSFDVSKGKKPIRPAVPRPASPPRARVFHTTSIVNDRFFDVLPLPQAWTQQHDRAICVLDSRNYSPLAIVSKLRRVFPELIGTLTPLMIEKRLRILDQNVEIDYWRIGTASSTSETREQRHVRWQTERVDSQTTLAESAATSKSRRATSFFKPSPKRQLPSSVVANGAAVARSFGTGFRSYLERL